MAAIVANIRTGEWSDELPTWADAYIKTTENTVCNMAACQVAEAFILLAVANNPRFDRERFLRACGLLVTP
jgi:hypothetical protein